MYSMLASMKGMILPNRWPCWVCATAGLQPIQAPWAHEVPADVVPFGSSQGSIEREFHTACSILTQERNVSGCLQVASLDLRTNVLAAYVSGNRAHEVPAVMEAMKITSKDSFEIGFNTACGLLAAGDYASAQDKLEHAQRLGDPPYIEVLIRGLCCVHAVVWSSSSTECI